VKKGGGPVRQIFCLVDGVSLSSRAIGRSLLPSVIPHFYSRLSLLTGRPGVWRRFVLPCLLFLAGFAREKYHVTDSLASFVMSIPLLRSLSERILSIFLEWSVEKRQKTPVVDATGLGSPSTTSGL